MCLKRTLPLNMEQTAQMKRRYGEPQTLSDLRYAAGAIRAEDRDKLQFVEDQTNPPRDVRSSKICLMASLLYPVPLEERPKTSTGHNQPPNLWSKARTPG